MNSLTATTDTRSGVRVPLLSAGLGSSSAADEEEIERNSGRKGNDESLGGEGGGELLLPGVKDQ